MTKYCNHVFHYEDRCFYCSADKLGIPENKLLRTIGKYFMSLGKSYSGNGCDRCGGPDEPYMLHDSMWNAATELTKENYLCLKCVEMRLGQRLKLKHFTPAPINFGVLGFDCRYYIRAKRPKAA